MRPPETYPGLDLLRFAAAALVTVGHIRAATLGAFGALPASDKSIFSTAFYFVTRLGAEAVVIFFVLSGFLIGGRYFLKISQGTFNALDYGIDRAVRIGLPLIPALLFSASFSLFLGNSIEPLMLMANLLSLQGVVVGCCYGGNAPLWSLPYEVWLYALVLVVGLWIKSTTARAGWLLAFALLALIFVRLELQYLLCWLIGAVAFVRRPDRFRPMGFALAVALICLGVLGSQLGVESASLSGNLSERLSAVLPGITISKSMLNALFPSVAMSRILLAAGSALLVQQIALWQPATRVGKLFATGGSKAAAFSFSLYLTHWPLIALLAYLGLKPESTMSHAALGTFAMVFAASLLLAWCAYWAFESRTHAVRDWIKLKLHRPSPPAITG